MSTAVLPLRAEPTKENERPSLSPRSSLTCRASSVRDSHGVQHVLLASEARRLQFAVTGVDFFSGARLLTDAVVLPTLQERRHLLLRQLSAVARTGELSVRLHAPDLRSARLRFVLQALDGWLANASQRDIAEAILGRNRVNVDWSDPSDHLRDRIRRAVRRGRGLMLKGYLGFLR
jgi:hypothetical protein